MEGMHHGKQGVAKMGKAQKIQNGTSQHETAAEVHIRGQYDICLVPPPNRSG
jgi:hypothetical protein